MNAKILILALCAFQGHTNPSAVATAGISAASPGLQAYQKNSAIPAGCTPTGQIGYPSAVASSSQTGGSSNETNLGNTNPSAVGTAGISAASPGLQAYQPNSAIPAGYPPTGQIGYPSAVASSSQTGGSSNQPNLGNTNPSAVATAGNSAASPGLQAYQPNSAIPAGYPPTGQIGYPSAVASSSQTGGSSNQPNLLTAGQTTISAAIQPLQSQVNTSITTLQTQASAGIQQLQAAANATIQNITSQVQASQNCAQQYVSSLPSGFQQVEDCWTQKITGLIVIFNATEAQIQQLLANQTAQIQATIQSFINEANSLESQISSDYTTCASGGSSGALLNVAPCVAAAVTEVASAVTTVTNAVTSTTQAISLLSAFTQLSSLAANIPMQIVKVDLVFIQCMLQAMPTIG